MTNEMLCYEAIKASENAYAPYSGCQVGAALFTKDYTVYRGCNIENASYSATICAERTAFCKAVSDGHREFRQIAVACQKNGVISGGFPPCGICRQVMAEFCDEDFEILVVTSERTYRKHTLSELLPYSFNPENMK